MTGGSGRSPTKALSGILIILGGLIAVLQAFVFVLANDWNGFILVSVAVAGLVFAVLIFKDWRQGLYIFFGWLFLEDFVRKYLGNNMAIYFAKDFLVILIYISYYSERRNQKQNAAFRPPFLVPLLIFFWFAAGQVFNPGSTSVFYGFLGLKLYFLYVPLMYLGYALMDTEADLRKFFMFNIVLIFIVSVLGIAQSIVGPSFLNPAILQEDIINLSTLYRVSPITGLIAYRPTSLFVSTGRFQNLIIVSWAILIGFGGYLILRSRKGRIACFVTIGVLASAVLMSTSRGVMMWCGGSALVIVAAFFWGARWHQKEVSRVVGSIQRIILLGGLALVLLSVMFPDEVNSRLAIYSETLSPYSSASELASRARDYPLQNFLAAFDTPGWMYGYGTGTASLGTQYVARILHASKTGIAVENGYGQLIVEMGIFGLVLWLVLGASLSFSAWRIVKQLRGSPWFPLAFVIFWFVFLVFFPMGYNSVSFYQDFLVNAYFWMLIGILFRLPKIAFSVQFASEIRPASSYLRASSHLPAKNPVIG
jgi:hypothetical protein